MFLIFGLGIAHYFVTNIDDAILLYMKYSQNKENYLKFSIGHFMGLITLVALGYIVGIVGVKLELDWIASLAPHFVLAIVLWYNVKLLQGDDNDDKSENNDASEDFFSSDNPLLGFLRNLIKKYVFLLGFGMCLAQGMDNISVYGAQMFDGLQGANSDMFLYAYAAGLILPHFALLAGTPIFGEVVKRYEETHLNEIGMIVSGILILYAYLNLDFTWTLVWSVGIVFVTALMIFNKGKSVEV